MDGISLQPSYYGKNLMGKPKYLQLLEGKLSLRNQITAWITKVNFSI